MSTVKSFEDWSANKSEELVHGTPGEDTSKNKGDESAKGCLEINEDSCCSTDCQNMINEMYETMCDEMKKCHGNESKMSAGDYHKECESMIAEMCSSLKEQCDKYMNKK